MRINNFWFSGDSRGKPEVESNNDESLNSELESILTRKMKETYEVDKKYQKDKRQNKPEPPKEVTDAKSKCKADLNINNTTKTACVKAVQNLRSKWNSCKAKLTSTPG